MRTPSQLSAPMGTSVAAASRRGIFCDISSILRAFVHYCVSTVSRMRHAQWANIPLITYTITILYVKRVAGNESARAFVCLELPVPLRVNFLLPARQHIVRREIAD